MLSNFCQIFSFLCSPQFQLKEKMIPLIRGQSKLPRNSPACTAILQDKNCCALKHRQRAPLPRLSFQLTFLMYYSFLTTLSCCWHYSTDLIKDYKQLCPGPSVWVGVPGEAPAGDVSKVQLVWGSKRPLHCQRRHGGSCAPYHRGRCPAQPHPS